MRHLALALLALPSLAHAEKLTVGASAGLYYFDSSSQPATDTLGVFGRLRATSRLGVQLEIQHVDAGSNTGDTRETAMLVVELASGPRWVPLMLAGAGLEQLVSYGSTTTAHHIEGGFGLEYRAGNGFVIGADARMGGRMIDSEPNMPVILTGAGGANSLPCCDVVPSGNRQYYSGRLYVGASF
jgi:hypothetical protein